MRGLTDGKAARAAEMDRAPQPTGQSRRAWRRARAIAPDTRPTDHTVATATQTPQATSDTRDTTMDCTVPV